MSGAVREGFLEEVITVKPLVGGAGVSHVDRGSAPSRAQLREDAEQLRKHEAIKVCT